MTPTEQEIRERLETNPPIDYATQKEEYRFLLGIIDSLRADTLSKETVREVLREVRQEQVDRCEYTLPSNSFWAISRIASALSLSLEDTNNA